MFTDTDISNHQERGVKQNIQIKVNFISGTTLKSTLNLLCIVISQICMAELYLIFIKHFTLMRKNILIGQQHIPKSLVISRGPVFFMKHI